MSYKAVIFDLDGTLLDTVKDLADGVNYALRTYSLPERSVDEIRSFVGNGVANLISRSVPAGTDAALCEKVLAAFRPYYSEHSRCKTKPYPGILNILDTLSERGIKTAIVSNKFDAAVKELNLFYFGDRIPVAIGERPEAKRKPAPDALFFALDELGISAHDAVYVGDSGVDVQTAANAGVDCVAVSWGFRGRDSLLENGADKIADTAEELLSFLIG